jgi:ATP-dependent Clp protease ATP-binding subunit ClpA
VEHLLYALLFDDDTGRSSSTPAATSTKAQEGAREVPRRGARGAPEDADDSPPSRSGFQRVVGRAAMHVQSSGKEELKGVNVLVALFAERDSPAGLRCSSEGSAASTW